MPQLVPQFLKHVREGADQARIVGDDEVLQVVLGGAGGRSGATARPGQLLPTELQEKLSLTAEQKEKIAKLQQEAETKLKEVLTDEQKKKLEEIKKEAESNPGRPGGLSPRRPGAPKDK